MIPVLLYLVSNNYQHWWISHLLEYFLIQMTLSYKLLKFKNKVKKIQINEVKWIATFQNVNFYSFNKMKF